MYRSKHRIHANTITSQSHSNIEATSRDEWLCWLCYIHVQRSATYIHVNSELASSVQTEILTYVLCFVTQHHICFLETVLNAVVLFWYKHGRCQSLTLTTRSTDPPPRWQRWHIYRLFIHGQCCKLYMKEKQNLPKKKWNQCPRRINRSWIRDRDEHIDYLEADVIQDGFQSLLYTTGSQLHSNSIRLLCFSYVNQLCFHRGGGGGGALLWLPATRRGHKIYYTSRDR